MDPDLELQLKEKIKEELLKYFKENEFKELVFKNERILIQLNNEIFDLWSIDVNFDTLSIKVNAWKIKGEWYSTNTVYWTMNYERIENKEDLIKVSLGNPKYIIKGKVKNVGFELSNNKEDSNPIITLTHKDFNLDYKVPNYFLITPPKIDGVYYI